MRAKCSAEESLPQDMDQEPSVVNPPVADPPAADVAEAKSLFQEVAEYFKYVHTSSTERQASPDRATERSRSPVSPGRSSAASTFPKHSKQKKSKKLRAKHIIAPAVPNLNSTIDESTYQILYVPTKNYLQNRNGNPIKVTPPIIDELDEQELRSLTKHCNEKRCGLLDPWYKQQIAYETLRIHFRQEPHSTYFEIEEV
jgi:hypothetical protein